jgi:nucleosome binding factor SPN SPT16 subunit
VPSLGVLFWLRRNVRHAFFQPAENEMITLVHFRLHNPIMVRLPAIGLQHPEFYF